MTLFHFEFKKILLKPLNWITLGVLLLLVTAVTVFHMIDSPPNAIVKAQKGPMTAEKIDSVIAVYENMVSNPDNFEHGALKASVYKETWRKYSKFEKYINLSYPLKDSNRNGVDLDAIDTLTVGEGARLYEERMARIKEQLQNGEAGYSDNSRDFLLNRQSQLKTPFQFDYCDGWQVAVGLMRIIILMIAAAVAVCLSPIFSYDYQCGMDQLIYTSKYGKHKLFWGKYAAGMLFGTLLYFGVMLCFTLSVLFVYGVDGYDAPFQLLSWFSPYNLTVFQAYIICVLQGYVSCIVFVSFIYLISVTLKKMELTLILSWVLLLLPLFIVNEEMGQRTLKGYLFDLMPTNMMAAYNSLGANSVYDILGMVMLPPYVQGISAVALSMLMAHMSLSTYRQYRVEGVMEVKI